MTARVFAVVLCLLWAAPAVLAAAPPSAAELESELVCPVCETTLDQSNAPVAERMKLYIRERIAAGDTEDEIKDALVAEFGPGVLASTGGGPELSWPSISSPAKSGPPSRVSLASTQTRPPTRAATGSTSKPAAVRPEPASRRGSGKTRPNRAMSSLTVGVTRFW